MIKKLKIMMMNCIQISLANKLKIKIKGYKHINQR